MILMLVYLVTIWLSASLSVMKSHWENTQIFKRVHTYTNNSLEMMCKKINALKLNPSIHTHTFLFKLFYLASTQQNGFICRSTCLPVQFIHFIRDIVIH